MIVPDQLKVYSHSGLKPALFIYINANASSYASLILCITAFQNVSGCSSKRNTVFSATRHSLLKKDLVTSICFALVSSPQQGILMCWCSSFLTSLTSKTSFLTQHHQKSHAVISTDSPVGSALTCSAVVLWASWDRIPARGLFPILPTPLSLSPASLPKSRYKLSYHNEGENT